MKKLMVSLLILAAFIGFALLWQNHVDGHEKELEEKSIEIMENLALGEKDRAEDLFAVLWRLWEESGAHWAMMMDHNDLEEMEGHLELSRAYCVTGELHESYGEMALFVRDLRNISRLYRPEWKNIL